MVCFGFACFQKSFLFVFVCLVLMFVFVGFVIVFQMCWEAIMAPSLLTVRHRQGRLTRWRLVFYFVVYLRCFFGAGSWEQHPKQRSPDLPLSSYLPQLIQGDHKAFPGQLSHIISPACPGSAPGPPPSVTCSEHPRGILIRCLTVLNVEEQ